jgi:transcriptional regulator with XRE-family HTH domain
MASQTRKRLDTNGGTGILGLNRIRELREAADIKGYELAFHIGVNPSTIWRWENGVGPIPDEQKFKLAKFFSVSVPWLMGWPDEQTDPTNGEPVAA